MSINIGVLDTPGAEAYFTKADPRIMCGCRATLEMLGIPLPDWAKRKPTGPKPGRAIAAAFRADHPETLYEATMRQYRAGAREWPTLSQRLAARAQSTANTHDPDADPLTL